MTSHSHSAAQEIFRYALQAVDPYKSVTLHAKKLLAEIERHQPQKVFVIGFGKAACPMAKSVETLLYDSIDTGMVITKCNHCRGYELKKIKVFEAGHPLPDKNGLRGTSEIIELLKAADEETLIVCLISGGGSALLVAPRGSISIDEKQRVTELLLKAGADINELNTLRKHISNVKGGRLAEAAYPARIISLVLSDVIGDRLDVISSGPTAPDQTTFSDALSVLKKYGLEERAPRSVIDVLKKGAENLIPETPKSGDKIFRHVENIIIGSNKIALDAAKQKAGELGFGAEVLTSELTGEAREAGRWLADKAKRMKGSRVQGGEGLKCLISGGETTVAVRGTGTGGRNMELALSFAIEVEGTQGVTLLSAGTDGTDGPTNAAGAIVDGETAVRARNKGIDPEEYRKNNDSYTFFKKTGGLFITGPTGTNVMDIQIIIIN